MVLNPRRTFIFPVFPQGAWLMVGLVAGDVVDAESP